jgi:hypothetical protein
MTITNPDWVPPIESTFDTGKAIRSEQGLMLAGNPIAIVLGKAGAPRVVDAALSTTATNTGRDWVLARNALSAAGAVGTYAFLGETTDAVTRNFGDTVAGSALRPAGIRADEPFTVSAPVTGALHSADPTFTPTGTWRCMGSARGATGVYGATLWLRIS